MTPLRLVEAAEEEQNALPQWGTIEELIADVREIKLTGGQVAILRAMVTGLEELGFRMYPGILDGIIKRWDEAGPVA